MSNAVSFTSNKSLGLFSLVMINVIAIDNLRSLTIGAEYGLSMIFFYAIAAVLFFIPTALVTAELATGWPTTGGVYVWVREAFGPRLGFLTIWLQWIYNVVWYPTIFAFIAGVLAYLIDPALVENKVFMLTVIIGAYWTMTLLNCLGLRGSSLISIVGAIVGTMFPMLIIAFLGFGWVYFGKPTHVDFSWRGVLPELASYQDLAFFTNILFGLMGIEMSAIHAGDVHDPRRNYPRALIYSATIILFTLVSACLAITIVIPVEKLNLVSGLMDAFEIFFTAYHMSWFLPVMGVLIMIGSLGGASTWILGPARGLLVAAKEGELPRWISKENKKNMPVGVLLLQGVIVTMLCGVFFIMPSVNSSYWILSNLTAQLALLFYLLLFAAAIRLRYKHPHVKRSYHIPGGKCGIWLVCGLGMMTCVATIVLGFFPPTQIAVGSVFNYELLLVIGMMVCCISPWVMLRTKKK